MFDQMRRNPRDWRIDDLCVVAQRFGLNVQQGKGSHIYLLGANVGMYIIWSTSGPVGALLGSAIPDPANYGLDLVFPLAFLGLLTAFLKNRIDLVVALMAGGLALLGALLLPGKWYIIIAGLLGSGLGLILEEVEKEWKNF
jgi:predicted branched-subunit amino acid permease